MTTLEALRQRYRDLALITRAQDRIADRDTDEFIGMIRMAMSDGILELHEADFMLRWLEAHRAVITKWPANVIYPRLVAALADEALSPDEEAELLDLLMKSIGDPVPAGDELGATRLPLTSPPPVIKPKGAVFCFTGRMLTCSRAKCHDLVSKAGGIPHDRITRAVNYLVVGDLGTPSWIHSSHGRKIEEAMQYNQDGKAKIRIVSEQHWAESLGLVGNTP